MLAWSGTLIRTLAKSTDRRVKLSDLVSILTRSRHFDGTSPVEVEMTESEGEVLNINSRKVRIILGDEEVSRLDTTLRGVGWCQEKIELLVAATSSTLNQALVNDAARGRVGHPAVGVLNEESLNNPLVDNDHRDLGLLLRCVVQLLDSLLELGDLGVKDLFALSITDTISVDHKVGWELVLVVLSEDLDGRLDGLLHLVLHDLLALLLDQVVRVVLTHILVRRSRETNDGLGTSVTNINTDQHGSLLVQNLWELQLEQVSTNLRVQLAKDVRSL